MSDQEGQLDADGKLTIEVPTATSDHGADYLYRVEARVTDAANREIGGTNAVIATYGSFAINVTPERYVYEPGSRAIATIQARDYDNHPVSTRAHVELVKWNYRNNESLISATDVNLDASGEAKATLQIPSQGGSCRVRATAKTPEGRQVSSTSYLWIAGGNWASESPSRNRVQILPDKKTYKAGDTAKLLIVAGQPGTAVYVTVEGRDVRQQRLIRAQGSTIAFELPVEAKYEPGITVSATFIRDGAEWNGAKYVRIPPVDHELNVRVATDKPQYLPGETAEYSIDVTDNGGKPVPRAEFSMGVVDEAIYGVRPDTTENILSYFFGHGYDSVNTQSSLQYFFSGQAGRRRMQLAELRPRSRLAQLKPERLVQPSVRKAFPDTAFWSPADFTPTSASWLNQIEIVFSLLQRKTLNGGSFKTKDQLRGIRRRKFVIATTNSNHARPVYPNLARGMVLTGINQLWVSDITYIRLESEFVYLAVILDAFSRRVIGWALDRTLEDELTISALRMALQRRCPEPRAGASFRSRRSVRIRRLHGSPESPPDHDQHEPEREPLR